MASDDLNEEEGNTPAKPARPVSARMAQNAGKPATGARPVSKGTTGSRPATGSRAAAAPTTGNRPVSARTAGKVPPPPVEQPPEMRATSTRAQVILDDFEKAGGKDNTMLYVYIAMAVIVIAGAIAGLMSYNINKSRKAATQEKLDTRDRVMKKIHDLNANSPTKYQEIIAACEEAMKAMQEYDFVDKEMRECRDTISNCNNMIEVEEAKKRNTALLIELEGAVKDYSKLSDVELRIKNVLAAATGMDEDYQKRAKQLQADLTLNTMKSYAAKAEEEAAKAGNDYARALEAYDAPFKKFKEFLKNYNAKGPAKDDPIIQTYVAMIRKSDELADKLCTPDFINKVPSRDMLAGKERDLWKTSKENGVDFTWSGRELVVAHKPVGDKKITEILGLNGWDAPGWYDVVFDLEFEILAGSVEMYLRYVPGLVNYTLIFDQKSGYELNQTYRVSFRVIGSKVVMTQADQPESGGSIDAKVSRTGGVGFGLPTGSRIAIKALSMKVLRTQSAAR